MPQNASQTRTALAALPSRNVAGTQVVNVQLAFDGVAYSPVALYDALDAAYGTVSSDDDSQGGRGSLRLRIAP